MNWKFHLIFIILILIGCSAEKPKESMSIDIKLVEDIIIPDTIVNIASLSYDRYTSIWTLNGKAFSGNVIEKFVNDSLKLKFNLQNGKKQNKSTEYYQNGQIKNISNYYDGKLHGENKTWTPDSSHLLITHLNYYLGKVHGEQKKWYTTGEIFMILHINMGREEGVQKAFRKNGVVYANYEAKKGRIFGLKKAALCYGLEDQKIKNDD